MHMRQQTLQIHPKDNVLAALQDLPAGTMVAGITAIRDVAAKHKLTSEFIPKNGPIIMYGVRVNC